MIRLRFVVALIFISLTTFAQEEKKELPKEGWFTNGDVTFLFSQSAFSNWVAGGENSISGNLGLNYNFNYVKGNLTWDNKIIASYGLVKTNNSEFGKKTDDRLEYNSILGFKDGGYWFYSAMFNFKTQITKGYNYTKGADEKEMRTEYTNFFSPAYLTLGPGMLWKKNDNFKFNLAPATAKLVLVNKDFTLPNDAYFGVEEGKSSRFELGFNASTYTKFIILENVTMENILNLYANYLEELKNIDIDYTININMKINKFLSSNLAFQTIYDDNAYGGFQTREVFGLGVNYIY